MGSCASRPDEDHLERRNRGHNGGEVIEVVSPVDTGRPPETVVTGANKPLKPFTSFKWKSDEPMSLSSLTKKRDAFWDTEPKFGGRQEIWGALRLACEAQTLELSQTVIDSAGITVPTGSLADGCYDELGNQYRIPQFCFSKPTNLVPDEPSVTHNTAAHDHPESSPITSPTIEFNQPLTMIPAESPLNTDLGPHIMIKVRLSSGKDVGLRVGMSETIGILKARVSKELSVSSEAQQNSGSPPSFLALFLGKKLDDHVTIEDAQIKEKSVVQFFELSSNV